MNQTDNGIITAYPLSWPTGWKRTEPRERQRARFSREQSNYYTRADGTSYRSSSRKEITIAVGIDRVLAELRGFGVNREDAIVSTNLVLKNDGEPRSGQRDPLDPGAAVYWARRGESQRCMAIDQYDRVADNLAAIAATLGAMRAIERHGGAEILNRAFSGFASLPAPQGSNWWEILGVSRTADKDTIRDAYRAKVKLAHPDNAETGDAERFIVIQKAYEASNA